MRRPPSAVKFYVIIKLEKSKCGHRCIGRAAVKMERRRMWANETLPEQTNIFRKSAIHRPQRERDVDENDYYIY